MEQKSSVAPICNTTFPRFVLGWICAMERNDGATSSESIRADPQRSTEGEFVHMHAFRVYHLLTANFVGIRT